VGTRLINLGTSEIVEIYRLRQLLESEAAYNACLHMTPEILEQVKQYHQEYQDILLASTLNAKDIHLKNREFHFTIYQASGMKRLCAIIEGLWDTLSFFKMLYGESLLNSDEGKQKMIAEHQSYIDYLEAGEAEKLREATRANITDKLNRYECTLKRTEDSI
jgi:DNA-binding GntR family transcriptional regulator